MAGPSQDQDDGIMGINVTPLVDITLVLLIIFMATAHMIVHRSMTLNLPKVAHSQAVPTQSLQILLSADKSLRLNDQPVTAQALAVNLAQMARLDAGLRVTLSADERVSWGDVAAVLDAIRGAGITRIATEVQPEESVMKPSSYWNEDYLLGMALILSLGVHALVFHAGEFSFAPHPKHTIEIDITNMGHLGIQGIPKSRPASAHAKPVAPAKAWVQPRPDQKVTPVPIPTVPVVATPPETTDPPAMTGMGTGEYSVGTGDGNSNALTRIPQLLNLSDLNAILQRFYPDAERAAAHEGTVVMTIHIDTEGHVSAVDVIRSGGADFDAAAVRVAKLLHFTPAFVGSQRVNVKMRQTIRFKLEA